MNALAFLTVLLAAVAAAACGGSDADMTSSVAETSTAAGACSEIEEVDLEPWKHVQAELTADDYVTSPPAGGDHNDGAISAGRFYTEPVSLGEAVHFLEHGAVIGWTNGLDAADQQAVEDAFIAVAEEGYYQLATVENPDLDVPFALSAWGALQRCETVDPSVIAPFIEEWYASPKSGESALACQGESRSLPPC